MAEAGENPSTYLDLTRMCIFRTDTPRNNELIFLVIGGFLLINANMINLYK